MRLYTYYVYYLIVITDEAIPSPAMKKCRSAKRKEKALMALERIQKAAVLSGLSKMTDREIEAEIKAARQERKKFDR